MSFEERQSRRIKGRLFKLLTIPVILIILLFLINILLARPQEKNTKIVSAVEMVSAQNSSKTVTPTNVIVQSDSLGEAVKSALIGTHGDYGVVVKNLKTGESYFQHEDTEYKSGSLYKLWVMGEVFEKINDGTLAEDQVLSESVENLNKRFGIDPENAERTEGVVTYSVSEALNRMITFSDNYSALLLTLKIRLSSVADYLEEKAFSESKVGTASDPPKTTPRDIALYFERLYKGELADSDTSKKMLDLLKAQKLNDKIPKYLPDNLTIAHKTGELDEVTHDAGIVYSPMGDYIIVILSQSDAPQAAAERVADISEAVYKYFNP